MYTDKRCGSRKSHLTRGAWIEMSKFYNEVDFYSVSHLTRGAWIEIHFYFSLSPAFCGSHLTRGAWIEIPITSFSFSFFTSHLTRGAWIEMAILQLLPDIDLSVAPHTRCVD